MKCKIKDVIGKDDSLVPTFSRLIIQAYIFLFLNTFPFNFFISVSNGCLIARNVLSLEMFDYL